MGAATELKRLRRLCLAIPGTTEKISHGEPTFFTPKRVFATFANNHHKDGHIAVWLPAGPGVQAALIEEAPELISGPRTSGRQGGSASSCRRLMTISSER